MEGGKRKKKKLTNAQIKKVIQMFLKAKKAKKAKKARKPAKRRPRQRKIQLEGNKHSPEIIPWYSYTVAPTLDQSISQQHRINEAIRHHDKEKDIINAVRAVKRDNDELRSILKPEAQKRFDEDLERQKNQELVDKARKASANLPYKSYIPDLDGGDDEMERRIIVPKVKQEGYSLQDLIDRGERKHEAKEPKTYKLEDLIQPEERPIIKPDNDDAESKSISLRPQKPISQQEIKEKEEKETKNVEEQKRKEARKKQIEARILEIEIEIQEAKELGISNEYRIELGKQIDDLQEEYRTLLGSGKNKDGITNVQIDKVMSKYKEYAGTIARDEIKSLSKRMSPKQVICFVMNMSKRNAKDGGSHWVAVFIDPKHSKAVEYFDSFGDPPPMDIVEGLSYLVKSMKVKDYLKFKYNLIKHQNSNSSNCGYFAMHFLIDRLRGKPFAECTGYNSVMNKDRSGKYEAQIEKLKKMKPFSYI